MDEPEKKVDTGPADPFTGLLHSAVALHEMFLNWVAGGFTENQALKLCAAVIAASADRDKPDKPRAD